MFIASLPSVAQTRANAASYTTVLSVVLTASAWLLPSPGVGAMGLSNGEDPTLVLLAVGDVGATATQRCIRRRWPPPIPAAGESRITASCGELTVGGGVRVSHNAGMTPRWPTARGLEAATGALLR